jgi:hypothetical protein
MLKPLVSVIPPASKNRFYLSPVSHTSMFLSIIRNRKQRLSEKIPEKIRKKFKVPEIHQNIKPELINLTGIYKISRKSNMPYPK